MLGNAYLNEIALEPDADLCIAASMFDNFDDVRADIERRLAEGASDRRSQMHTPVVATADADARVMVLRAFDPANWTLRFHTDARSPKVSVIDADPRVGVLAYDRDAKLQLRIRGTARIETDSALADTAWAESTNFARRCYLGEAPGKGANKPVSGLPEAFEGCEPDENELIPARENFAILLVDIRTVDWFSLAHTGHRRALILQDGGRWITP